MLPTVLVAMKKAMLKVSPIVEQLEEDNLFDGLDPSVPPQPDCKVCDGTMTPKSYIGIRGVHYEYKYNK